MAKVDVTGEGSEISITEKINYDTSLDAFKGPPTLEVGENPDAGSSPESENAGSEAKKYGAIDTVLWDKLGKYPYYDVCGIMDYLTMKLLR